MNANYSFRAAMDQGEKLQGKNISIDAVLVIQGGEAYLVESVAVADSLARIPVHCPNLELQLDLCVGGWMGGLFLY